MNTKQKVILFNCTTNIIGGGVKNSAIFIQYIMVNNENNYNWLFAVSPQVNNLLQKLGVQLNEKFFVFQDSPSKNLKSRQFLKRIVKENNVDLVYTMAGPSYVKFNVKHIMGLSNPYITHGSFKVYLLQRNKIKLIKMLFNVIYQFLHSLKGDYYVFQTNYARSSFLKRSFKNTNDAVVISNAFDLNLPILKENNFIKNKKTVIFCPGAPYIHKGIQFIPNIALELSKIAYNDFEFIITIPEGEFLDELNTLAKELNVSNKIKNVGLISYSEVSDIYQISNIVFVPSFLETFSATYLEAIMFEKPLIVNDLDFAKDICDNNASFVDCSNFKLTAEVIHSLINNPISKAELIDRKDKMLRKYFDQKTRSRLIVNEISKRLGV